MTSRQTKEEINCNCFSPWLTCGLFTWEGQALWNIAPEENAELYTGCWLVIFLSLNVFHCIRSNEWNPYNSYQGDWKNGHKRAALSQFISPGNCYSYSSHNALLWSWTILSNLYLDLDLHLYLSLHPAPHSFSLNPAILLPLHCVDALLLASPYTASHLRIIYTLINPGSVLLLKGEGYPSGSTSFAMWKHKWRLLGTFLL